MGILKTVGLIFVGLVVVGAVVGKDDQSKSVNQSAAQLRNQAPPEAAVATAQVRAPLAAVQAQPVVVQTPAMPSSQSMLVQIHEAVQERLRAANNELQRGALRPWRSKATCMNIKTTAAKDWVGTIDTLTTNNDGKGVLKIEIGNDIAVTTWNNALSDIGSNTLIEPESALYQKIISLNEGDAVIFSGSFFQSDVDCLQEGSMTLSGSLSDPEYIMKFADIRKAN